MALLFFDTLPPDARLLLTTPPEHLLLIASHLHHLHSSARYLMPRFILRRALAFDVAIVIAAMPAIRYAITTIFAALSI